MFTDAGVCPSDDEHQKQGTIIKTTNQHSSQVVTRLGRAKPSQSPTGTKARARWCVFLTVTYILGVTPNGALTPPASVRYSVKDFQDAVSSPMVRQDRKRSCWISPINLLRAPLSTANVRRFSEVKRLGVSKARQREIISILRGKKRARQGSHRWNKGAGLLSENHQMTPTGSAYPLC
jgi:hypothetical protein